MKRAHHSSGRKVTHPATVAPAGSNRSVRSGQLLRAKSLVKEAAKAVSEQTGHNMNQRRASLEKGNVNAELVRYRRRPQPHREASDGCTGGEHRGIGDGMSAKERSVNTGSPRERGARPQPEAREGKTGLAWVAERLVVAMKRATTVEQRSPGSRATQQRARARRLT